MTPPCCCDLYHVRAARESKFSPLRLRLLAMPVIVVVLGVSQYSAESRWENAGFGGKLGPMKEGDRLEKPEILGNSERAWHLNSVGAQICSAHILSKITFFMRNE